MKRGNKISRPVLMTHFLPYPVTYNFHLPGLIYTGWDSKGIVLYDDIVIAR